jgi:dienelactone hydrolase
MRHASILTIALAVLVASAHSTAAQAPIDAGSVGAPRSNARAELFLPAGSGRFPAMVVLHGCDGVGPHYRDWARELAGWGYVALLVDSFRPRGYRTVCNRGMDVPPLVQAQDAFDAAAYLRSLANVRADRIGVIGFSHGGWAVLKAVLADTVRQDRALPFAAAIAFYPGCDPPDSALASDTLILIGDADDWTPVARCERWRHAVETGGHALEMKIYPGALHGFDARTPPRMYAGHHVGRNQEAAEDAVAATRSFLAARLIP